MGIYILIRANQQKNKIDDLEKGKRAVGVTTGEGGRIGPRGHLEEVALDIICDKRRTIETAWAQLRGGEEM